jgi:hypothetical protein
MAISFNDNIRVNAGKPIDAKFGPYTSISEANSSIPLATRHNGLIFGVYEDPSDIPNSDIKYYYYYGSFTDVEINEFIFSPISGTTNYIPKFTTDTTIGDSKIFDNGTNIGINTTSPTNTLDINGTLRIRTANNGTGNFISISTSGVIQQRTPNDVLLDINAVPYSGATKNVILGEYGLEGNYLKLNTNPVNLPEDQGTIFWDVDDNTIAVVLNGYVMKVGEDVFYAVKNQTGSTITKGTACGFAGTVGSSGRLLTKPYLANGVESSTFFMGVAAEEILDGEDGKVLWFGRIRGLNTNAFDEGDILYVSTSSAGGFQTTIPQAPNNIIQVAAVINKSTTQGVIFVRPTIGSNINKDEGVKIDTPLNNDVLKYNSTSGLFENAPETPPVAGEYASEAAMIAGQANQIANFIYFDGTKYWEYLGTSNGTIVDYRAWSGGDIVQPNGLTQIGTFVQTGNDIDVNPDWIWRFNQVLYQKTTITPFTIAPAAVGFTRIDLIYGNTSTQVLLISGTEVEDPTPAVPPSVPANSVGFFLVFVDDSGITAFQEFALSSFVRFDVNNQNLSAIQRQNARTNIQALSRDTNDSRTGTLTQNGQTSIIDSRSGSSGITFQIFGNTNTNVLSIQPRGDTIHNVYSRGSLHNSYVWQVAGTTVLRYGTGASLGFKT